MRLADQFTTVLAGLGIVCAAFAWKHHSITSPKLEAEHVPNDFWRFQRNYLVVYLLCTFSDWLKGPYVYALYEDYGFGEVAIAWLFIGGYLSSLVFGTLAGSLSDKYGRRLLCRVFCVVYAASAVTKVFNNFSVLFLGRVLSGIATSLLFTTFEAWMVSEHHSRGFSPTLLTHTFSKATLLNGIVAIASGIVAQFAASTWGYAAPFLVAIPCLLLAGLFTRGWPENYGDTNVLATETLIQGWKSILAHRKLQLLGSCEAIFEGCLYIWVFYWTPSISALEERHDTPLGIAFACFMAALMVGGTLPHIFNVNRVAVPLHLATVVSVALAAVFFSNKFIVFIAFVLYEGCVGAYFPTHGTLRGTHIDEATRASVMNIFRVPLNLVVIFILQVRWDPRTAIGLCALGKALSLLCYWKFAATAAAEEKNGRLYATPGTPYSTEQQQFKNVEL